MRVAGLLLAAGAGRRFGSPKALVPLNGKLFVDSAAELLRAAGCTPVVVVLGAAADQVRARAELTGVTVVDNPGWESGMGSSLRTGLHAVGVVDAVVVLPVDTPGVTVAALHRLMALAEPKALARAVYDGEIGHPVLIGSDHFPGVVSSAAGDQGARDYLRAGTVRHVECSDVADGADVDRPEDLRGRAT
ncbi:molybdopterin-guanine dinucleotide biosynthesis protein A [Lentzea guizhouensis]|uniref:Molybdopterin-guanine dinucleotide biosynthesis protein A n=1 Tax=Lentzea guizhouensis TaxID=1586287 RepID=A0A1B2HNM1_9PSEU|nr:nucleotidyltransferase family protein [Lentzea guizhouensis]ANZ39306.1 molybdopterin-guanine dinucleotide biosynthesis protein A [Lentzea guizhouensis]